MTGKGKKILGEWIERSDDPKILRWLGEQAIKNGDPDMLLMAWHKCAEIEENELDDKDYDEGKKNG